MRLQGGCYDLDAVVSEIGAPFLYILDDSWRLTATYKFATSTYDDREGLHILVVSHSCLNGKH